MADVKDLNQYKSTKKVEDMLEHLIAYARKNAMLSPTQLSCHGSIELINN
jgi:hypothetical protein